jgi:hypothetical protein
MEFDDVQTDPGLEALRAHRAELLESMRALELALAFPATGRESVWAERVTVALVEIESDFAEHVQLTEGPEGLYRALLETAPHLANSVSRLTAEHNQIKAALALLLADEGKAVSDGEVDGIREAATAFLGRLSRHRQRGADLVYEAYQTDIGGET